MNQKANNLDNLGFYCIKENKLYSIYAKPIHKKKKILCFIIHSRYVLDKYFARWVMFDNWYTSKTKENISLFDLEDFLIFYYQGKGKLFSNAFVGWYLQSKMIATMFAKYQSEITSCEAEIMNDLIANQIIVKNAKGILSSTRYNGGVIIVNEETMHQQHINLHNLVNHELCHAKYQFNKEFHAYINNAFDSLSDLYKKTLIAKLYKIGYHAKLADEWAAMLIEGGDNAISPLYRNASKEDKLAIANIHELYYKAS